MNVILSIKPEFVEKIFSGEKKFEYRKVLFRQKVDRVYIYATRPISKIVGEFKISGIVTGSPEEVWNETKRRSGISKSVFDNYFKGREKSYAIGIDSPKEYELPIDTDSILKHFTAPQSYIYTEYDIKD